MSIWTHVVGVIRFDGIEGLMPKPDLGLTASYDDDEEAWDKCNVPCGSEGSISHSLSTNPRDSSVARYVANIFGDLRDYEDTNEVIEYFNRIVEGQMVRQGMFSVSVEYGDTRSFFYDDGKWIELTIKDD